MTDVDLAACLTIVGFIATLLIQGRIAHWRGTPAPTASGNESSPSSPLHTARQLFILPIGCLIVCTIFSAGMAAAVFPLLVLTESLKYYGVWGWALLICTGVLVWDTRLWERPRASLAVAFMLISLAGMFHPKSQLQFLWNHMPPRMTAEDWQSQVRYAENASERRAIVGGLASYLRRRDLLDERLKFQRMNANDGDADASWTLVLLGAILGVCALMLEAPARDKPRT